MSIENIGKTISRLRKEKGMTQEELGTAIGVTSQAVSKWECGSTPDVELLPRIADAFGVSLDLLFGREHKYEDVCELVAKRIVCAKDKKEQIETAFLYGIDLQMAVFGAVTKNEEELKKIANGRYRNSALFCDEGIALLDMSEQTPSFFLMPYREKTGEKLLENHDYAAFFRRLADEDFWNTLLFLCKRKSQSKFTEKLLVDACGLASETAKEYLDVLEEWGMIYRDEAEIDDVLIDVYHFYSSDYLPAFLTFAAKVMDRPTSFYRSSRSREKPILS